MSDPFDLIDQAEELRRLAKREVDEDIRNRLLQIANRYVHLAALRIWKKQHPLNAASLIELFSMRS
jgi:hypothetical protein